MNKVLQNGARLKLRNFDLPRERTARVLDACTVEGNTGADDGHDGDGGYLKEREWSESGDNDLDPAGIVRSPINDSVG